MTGIGPVSVRQPRVRDREAADGERIRFSPTILPPYARRTKSPEVLIPILYLKGISTGDFEEVLAALVGKDAPRLSASTIPPQGRVDRGTRALAKVRSFGKVLRLLLGTVVAFEAFAETYEVKYEKAVDCLTKDRDVRARLPVRVECWKPSLTQR